MWQISFLRVFIIIRAAQAEPSDGKTKRQVAFILERFIGRDKEMSSYFPRGRLKKLEGGVCVSSSGYISESVTAAEVVAPTLVWCWFSHSAACFVLLRHLISFRF